MDGSDGVAGSYGVPLRDGVATSHRRVMSAGDDYHAILLALSIIRRERGGRAQKGSPGKKVGGGRSGYWDAKDTDGKGGSEASK
jgi:hypothetical protein